MLTHIHNLYSHFVELLFKWKMKEHPVHYCVWLWDTGSVNKSILSPMSATDSVSNLLINSRWDHSYLETICHHHDYGRHWWVKINQTVDLVISVYHEPSIMIQSAKFGCWDFCTACAKPHLWPVLGDALQVTSTVQAEGNLRAQYLAFFLYCCCFYYF